MIEHAGRRIVYYRPTPRRGAVVLAGARGASVLERAQQKLKLDAMVVQQGRLQNKDKLSKNELMDALRFGADKVGRRAGDDATIAHLLTITPSLR